MFGPIDTLSPTVTSGPFVTFGPIIGILFKHRPTLGGHLKALWNQELARSRPRTGYEPLQNRQRAAEWLFKNSLKVT